LSLKEISDQNTTGELWEQFRTTARNYTRVLNAAKATASCNLDILTWKNSAEPRNRVLKDSAKKNKKIESAIVWLFNKRP
jgi:hypothetical protein